jgi:hypothetical protein
MLSIAARNRVFQRLRKLGALDDEVEAEAG